MTLGNNYFLLEKLRSVNLLQLLEKKAQPWAFMEGSISATVQSKITSGRL